MKLFLILLLCASTSTAQDCLHGIDLSSYYKKYEIYNHTTKAYEPYHALNKLAEVNVQIHTESREIRLNELGVFKITRCLIIDTAIIYQCKDANQVACFLVFGNTSQNYTLTILYKWKSLIYRLLRRKENLWEN